MKPKRKINLKTFTSDAFWVCPTGITNITFYITYNLQPVVHKFVEISSGLQHNIAKKANGNVWSWGYNGFGQLGNNSTKNSSIPVQVIMPTK